MKYNRGFSILGVIVTTAIVGIGISTAAVIIRSEMHQKQSLTAQSQRATYATFQNEITVHGINPAKIVNPLASIEAPSTANPESDAGSVASIGHLNVATSGTGTTTGGSTTNAISTTAANASGDRVGGLGLSTSSTGTATTSTSLTLSAPVFSLGTTTLVDGSFPATNWFTLPANPPGTVYRFTTDGSTPTSSSSLWDAATAAAITVANFPSQIRIRAFHSNANYAASTTTATGTLSYQLSSPVDGRQSTPEVSTYVVTYTEQFGSPTNGVTLTEAATVAGVTTTIYYTTDGSDPSSSGTRLVYSGAFVIPTSSWSWSGDDSEPAMATVRAVVVGPDARYLTSTVATDSYLSQATVVSAPAFSEDSSTGPIEEGESIGFTAGFAGATVYYETWGDPGYGSPAGWGLVF